MDITDRLLELELKDKVFEILPSLFSNDPSLISQAKKHLRDSCGIIFVQVAQNNRDKAMIIVKNINSSFIYEYDKLTCKLDMKGERKNANIK